MPNFEPYLKSTDTILTGIDESDSKAKFSALCPYLEFNLKGCFMTEKTNERIFIFDNLAKQFKRGQ